ncbi:competence protein CoiA family protein [Pedobacter gandavensis]|uniref:Competence protein n=1 Tax=Pedobacter gandavensis TaxID=2679963 RepID=A0ABR6ESK8_9SPHI|nr:competence protein [Pedobacter gandavensis]MBB2148211.1 competence protein [Pedobacter gandavensis]
MDFNTSLFPVDNSHEPDNGQQQQPILRSFGETPWHRNWKKEFPASFREVSFSDQALGELHRADVHTSCGTTIEFQNSPICLQELESREAYYPKLVWVLNGKKFKGFRILKHLPDVDDPRLSGYEFCHMDHLSMIRKADLLQAKGTTKVLNFHHPELKNIPLTSHYYSFCWKNPHRVWYQAKCPLIVDLGGHFLYQLKQRKQLSGDYPYLHMIPRKDFLALYIR